jgi:16S rRNA (cytosine967-C5)-methyltransferase
MKSLKVHKPLLEIVCHALGEIFDNRSYADKEVPKILKLNRQLGSRDRAFVAETIYDVVRWKLNYENALPAGIPESMKWEGLVYLSLLNNPDYKIQNPDVFKPELRILEGQQIDMDPLKSFPDWINARCRKELGGSWPEIARGLSVRGKVYIRINTLKTDTEKFLETLNSKQVESKPNPLVRISDQQGTMIATPECVEILSKNNLKSTHLYEEGLFEFQDVGSQIVGYFCEATEDRQILDLCAGAGGKTLHLSALMQNKGTLYATDFKHNRMDQLQKRAAQAGCENIKIMPFKAAQGLKDLDLVLIDAPCSGTGTFRRNPDQKFKLEEKFIDGYVKIQSDLLFRSKFKVRKGGKMVYVTCSVLPSEGEAQVRKFLSNFRDFELTDELRLNPNQYDGDGFYMAKISRK